MPPFAQQVFDPVHIAEFNDHELPSSLSSDGEKLLAMRFTSTFKA